jgi:hypothetical protein
MNLSSQDTVKSGPLVGTNIMLMLGNESLSYQLKSRWCIGLQAAVREREREDLLYVH